MSPGTPTAEILADAQEAANSEGTTVDAALQQALLESQSSILGSLSFEPVSKDEAGTDSSSSGGGSDAVTLGAGNRAGDVFYSPASTLFVSHGHSGIYHSMNYIVEAPGTGKTVRYIAASSVKVAKGAKKQTVDATSTVRTKARDFAYGKLGKAYNSNFAFNKTVNDTKYNCSQLVWAAFKDAGSLDLDSNGGTGVYPANIRDSKYTTTFKTL